MPASVRPRPRRSHGPARIVVLGDLVVDVVLRPDRPLEHGTDVPGRVFLAQGGSAATAARWLGRLGARSSLIARGRSGRRRPGARRRDPRRRRHAARRPRRRRADGQDRRHRHARRRALVRHRPRRRAPAPAGRPQAGWFARADALHLPVYSLLDEPLGLRRPPGDRAGPRARAPRSASTSPRSARCSPAAAERARALIDATSRRTSCSRPPRRRRRCSAGTPSRACSTSRTIAVVKRGRQGRHGPRPRGRRRALRFEVATEHDRRRPTRPAPATRSMPASSSAGSRPAPPAGRSRRHSSGPPSPVIGRPREQLTTPRAELPIA